MKINVETAAKCIVQNEYCLNKKTMGALKIVILPPRFSYYKCYVPTYHGEEAIHLHDYYFAGGRYLFGYGFETNTVAIKEDADELGTMEELFNDLNNVLTYIENQY